MRMTKWIFLASALSMSAVAFACSSFVGEDDAAPAGPDAAADAPPSPPAPADGAAVDASPPTARRCALGGRFMPPVRLELSGDAKTSDLAGRLTADEREIYFALLRDGQWDLMVASARVDGGAAFDADASRPVSNITSAISESFPTLTPDEKTLIFARYNEQATTPQWQLVEATRASLADPFVVARTLPHASKAHHDYDPFLTADGVELWWTARPMVGGALRIRYAPYAGGTAANSVEIALGAGATENVRAPVLTPDKLTLYFGKTSATGDYDLYAARRDALDKAFGSGERVGELSSLSHEFPSWVSPDGCVLAFTRHFGGVAKVMLATREPADAPPNGGSAPSTIQSASHVADFGKLDVTTPIDGALAKDGTQTDGVFDVELTGPFDGVGLITTDNNGAPAGSMWDTWVGPDMIPPETGFSQGATTWQLAVYEGNALLNDAAGRVTLPPGRHRLQLVASANPAFVAGKTFCVVGTAPDGSLRRGPLFRFGER